MARRFAGEVDLVTDYILNDGREHDRRGQVTDDMGYVCMPYRTRQESGRVRIRPREVRHGEHVSGVGALCNEEKCDVYTDDDEGSERQARDEPRTRSPYCFVQHRRTDEVRREGEKYKGDRQHNVGDFLYHVGFLMVGLDITNGATASLKLVTRLEPTMNVKILSKTDDETEVEVEGEDHTLMNVLKDALLRLEEVEAATYDMNPEQSGGQTEPIMYVKTDGSDPLDALQDATEEIQKDASEFREAFEGAIA